MSDAEREALIEKMTDASYDGGMAAALAVAIPVIRKDALEEAVSEIFRTNLDNVPLLSQHVICARDNELVRRLRKLSETE